MVKHLCRLFQILKILLLINHMDLVILKTNLLMLISYLYLYVSVRSCSVYYKLLIVILHHLEGFKNFKYYYKYAVEIKYKNLFKQVPCYDRFIQIMPNYQCHLAYYYSAYLVRQEEFTFWMQPRYQSAIAGEKKEIKFSARLQKNIKLPWVGFLDPSCI